MIKRLCADAISAHRVLIVILMTVCGVAVRGGELDYFRALLPDSVRDAEGLRLASVKEVTVISTRKGDVYILDKRRNSAPDPAGLPLLFSIAGQLGADDSVQNVRLDSKGKVWLNTTKGVFIHAGVELSEQGDTDPMPADMEDSVGEKIFFSNIKLSGNYIVEKEGGKEKDLIGPIRGVRDISLSAPPNAFSLSVLSLDGNSADCQFSWKLEGFDDNWSIPSANSYINYTNLSPGSYTLMVRMRQGEGLWQRSISIVVESPVTSTLWFRNIIGVALVAVIVMIALFHRRRRSRRQEAAGIKEPDTSVHIPVEVSDPVGTSEPVEASESTDTSEPVEASEPVETSTSRDEFLQRAEAGVRTNIANESFDKAEFASYMMISQSLLYKKIKAYTGMSVIEFIRSIRLRYAKELLRSGRYNVTEVSDLCGFSSSAYFSRVFKEYYGKNPSELSGRSPEE